MAVDDFSDTAVNTFRAQHSAEVSVTLLTIRVPGFKTYRLVNSGQPVTSQGVMFDAWHFDLVDPQEDDNEPEGRLSFVAINQEAAKAIESTGDEIEVQWDEVLASSPDTIDRRWRNFVARDVEVNDILVTCALRQKEYARERRPPRTVDPTGFPGLFKAQ